MKPLTRWSEPFGAHGGFHAHSAGQTLGRPDLDQHSLLLRESVQNSWDARKGASIAFRMDLVRPTSPQRDFLFNRVLTNPPKALKFGPIVSSRSLSLLVITDQRTRGLGGPTRSDQASGGRKDFVGLVRNIGRSQDKQIGGGTYGFGKGILFDTSAVGTVLIYTRTKVGNSIQSRFIAAGIGDDFEEAGKPYTGRHWWGHRDREVGVEPYLDDEADACADGLGMNFLGGLTGTSIAIVAPRSNEKDFDSEDVDLLAAAALEWAWPHMVGTRGRASIEFAFSDAGREVPVVDPRTDPLYKHYVRAYELAESTTNDDIKQKNEFVEEYPNLKARIWSERPLQPLGSLAVSRFAPKGLDPTEKKLSKVALMRKPRFVVKYMAVEKDPSDLVSVGVFIADSEVDEKFADAEPVAHDDWQPSSLGRGQRNVVRIGLNKISAIFSERGAGQAVLGAEDRTIRGVSALSTSLGDVISGLSGGSAKVQRASRSAKAGTRKPPGVHSASVEGVKLLSTGRDIYAQFTVRLRVAEAPLPVTFTALPKVVLDGGGTSELDEVAAWSEPGDVEFSTSDSIAWEIPGEHLVHVTFRQPDQARSTVEIRSEVAGE